VWMLASLPTALAQEHRFELGGVFGYTFSEGVRVDPGTVAGAFFDEVYPKSGLSYGTSFGVFLTEDIEVEFSWSQQDSTLAAEGETTREFADMKINNYHVNFVYNWGNEESSLRPFLFGGLGATQYRPGDIMGATVEGSTRFSSTWGGGIKFYTGRNFGLQLRGRWTPTYIKSDPAGIWCSSYWPWGCYLLQDSNFSHQLEIAGGVSFRF